MQIWFSAINILVLPSSSACCPWDNINELAFHYFWSPTAALRKGKYLKINKLTLKPNHHNAFGWKFYKMGLNTNVLIIKSIPNKDFIDELFDLLNLKIIKTHKGLNWSKLATICYQNQDSVSYVFLNNTLYLECRYNIFLTYSKPIILQELGKNLEIFIYEISETVDISSYWIFKNGEYYNKIYGMDGWDLPVLETEKDYETENPTSNQQILIENTALAVDLDAFIKEFNYDILFESTYDLAEIKNLEVK